MRKNSPNVTDRIFKILLAHVWSIKNISRALNMSRNYETYRSIFCAAKISLNFSASIFATEQKLYFRNHMFLWVQVNRRKLGGEIKLPQHAMFLQFSKGFKVWRIAKLSHIITCNYSLDKDITLQYFQIRSNHPPENWLSLLRLVWESWLGFRVGHTEMFFPQWIHPYLNT